MNRQPSTLRTSHDVVGRAPGPNGALGFVTFLVLAAFSAGWPAEAKAGEVAVSGGWLVIVGGGVLPDTVRERFLELAGGKNARIVVIPTASGKADRVEALKGYAFWKAQKVASVVFLHTRRLLEANDPKFVKPLTEATGVWISGGDQSLLMAAYRGTAVERELRKLLDRGGVIGGTSAGAAVMSSVMIVGGNPLARVGQGFGLLPGVVVDQHFQNRNRLARLQGVLARHPHYLGLGIDEQTAAVVHGRLVTVMGNANVRLCVPAAGPRPARVQVLKAGERIDLEALGRATAAAGRTPPAPPRTPAPTPTPPPMPTRSERLSTSTMAH